MEKEEEIRMIAYSLWVQDGCRHGSVVRQWLRAEAIWEQNHRTSNIPEPPTEKAGRLVMQGNR